MKIAVVGTPGGWSSERLADAVAEKTGQRILVDMKQVRLDLDSGSAWFGAHDLSTMDGLIIKKIGSRYSPYLLDRLEILRFLEGRGVRIFSPPTSIIRVLDRLTCTVTMRLAGIPMPPTTITESVDEAVVAVEGYGEAVFKPLYTSKARGMTVLRKGEGLREAIKEYKQDNLHMYIQKTIDLDGKDLGIAFLGGEYLTTYARCKTNGAWNTTTVSGGRYASFDPSGEVVELARKAQSLFDLDFTCVDVALTDDGPYVFEVSAFGGFRGLLDARSMDAAGMYADYVARELGR